MGDGMGATKVRLADRVAKDLQHMIFTEYKPGDKLPVENELANLYSVSRITVREAVSRLNTMGIVDVRQGEGTFVKQLTPVSFMRSMLPMLTLSKKDVKSFIEVRILIECKAVELTARHAGEEELQKLKSILEDLELTALTGDVENYHKKDLLFHRTIVEYCRNPILAAIHEMLSEMIMEVLQTFCISPNSTINAIVYHNRIYRAIEQHSEVDAVAEMEEHLKFGLDDILNAVDDDSTALPQPQE